MNVGRTWVFAGPVDFVILYKVGALPAVNNPVFDMSQGGTWTTVGLVTVPAAPPASSDTLSISLEGLVPKVANVWVGIISRPDYENNFADIVGIHTQAAVNIGTIYDCP